MKQSPRSRRLAVLCVVAMLALASLAAGREKPNVIFILADDLGYGDAGFTWQSCARLAEMTKILDDRFKE